MDENAVFTKTKLGKSAITERSTNLSAKQRQLLIMIDGKKRLRDIFPTIDEITTARVNSLFEDGFIDSPGSGNNKLANRHKDPKIQQTLNHKLSVNSLPSSQNLTRLRGILAMCSQQYLNDELDTLLTDYYDQLSTVEELQICIDHWLKRMKKSQPDSVTEMYMNQLRSFIQ